MSTTIMGANFEESLLGKAATKWSVRLRPHPLSNGLRKVHPAGKRAKILYFFDAKKFSKALASKKSKGQGTVIEEMDLKVAEIFGDEPFLYATNKSHKARAFRKLRNAVEMPIFSHGINKYKEYTKIYISAALNRSPKHLSMLKCLGYDGEVVLNATPREISYQAVMRTALRDMESEEEVTIIVPDFGTGKFIADKIGTDQLIKIGSSFVDLERPHALTDSERAKRCRLKKFVDEVFCPQSSQRPLKKSRDVPEPAQTEEAVCLDSEAAQPAEGSSPEEAIGGSHSSVLWTFHRSEKAFKRGEFVALSLTVTKLVAMFKRFAETVQEQKGAGILFNAATYDPKHGEGYRRQEHFVVSNAMILDFDGGELSPEEFEYIFDQGEERPHSFVIMNSFSRCAEKPNHFRVVLFYREPASSIEEHKAVYDYVVGVLNSWGISEDSAKLDPNCKSGIMSVWMPCTNFRHREWAFFRSHHTSDRDVKRFGLVPSDHVKVQKKQLRSSRCPWEPVFVPDEDVSARINRMKSEILAMHEGRRAPVYRLGLILRSAGRNVSAELEELARGRDANLRRHVEGVIKSLCR